MNEEELEQAIVDKGLKYARITPERIDRKIKEKHFFRASDAIYAPDSRQGTGTPLHLITECVLVLENGFTVTGYSSCASPENFDYQIGKTIAFANAREKIWVLEGYLLKQKLYEESL
jgi:hypothetical protein